MYWPKSPRNLVRKPWVIPSLGPTAIISAGSGIKNYVRHAIQTLSISGAALNES
jgi:hypothetical protein